MFSPAPIFKNDPDLLEALALVGGGDLELLDPTSCGPNPFATCESMVELAALNGIANCSITATNWRMPSEELLSYTWPTPVSTTQATSKSTPRSTTGQRVRKVESRKRESIQRTNKFKRHQTNRNRCLEDDKKLREKICLVIEQQARKRNLPVEHVIHDLPQGLRAIMLRCEHALPRYRTFIGQKTLSERINARPTWPSLTSA